MNTAIDLTSAMSVCQKIRVAVTQTAQGAELEVHYGETLREFGSGKGMLGQIFTKAQNKITDLAKLAPLIEMADSVSWLMLGSDTKGDVYEGILEKNAEDNPFFCDQCGSFAIN